MPPVFCGTPSPDSFLAPRDDLPLELLFGRLAQRPSYIFSTAIATSPIFGNTILFYITSAAAENSAIYPNWMSRPSRAYILRLFGHLAIANTYLPSGDFISLRIPLFWFTSSVGGFLFLCAFRPFGSYLRSGDSIFSAQLYQLPHLMAFHFTRHGDMPSAQRSFMSCYCHCNFRYGIALCPVLLIELALNLTKITMAICLLTCYY